MSRGIDHIVHAVTDLEAASDFYRRLGFVVGARNRHPWGTHNRIVQLAGAFIEILTVAEPEKLGSDGFSRLFGDFNRRFLQRGEGLSLLILKSGDAEADARSLQRAAIGASSAMRFEREGKAADGSAVTLAFSLVFAQDALAPGIGFAVCHHHYPQNFWNADLQRHQNGVARLAGAVLVAENPTDHHIFLEALTGVRDLHSSSAGILAATARGEIQVMTPIAFADHFAVAAPDIREGARLAAMRFAAGDLATVEACLSAAAIPSLRHLGRLIVAPDTAFGATLVFEAMSER